MINRGRYNVGLEEIQETTLTIEYRTAGRARCQVPLDGHAFRGPEFPIEVRIQQLDDRRAVVHDGQALESRCCEDVDLIRQQVHACVQIVNSHYATAWWALDDKTPSWRLPQ
jgi:hypothetical protein